jgi:tetratricopeptide (TPR) repeat protein
MEPILDKDIKVSEKDLQDDTCEIEMRLNLVVTLLMNIGYCYMKLFYYDEALKCFNYAIELAP